MNFDPSNATPDQVGELFQAYQSAIGHRDRLQAAHDAQREQLNRMRHEHRRMSGELEHKDALVAAQPTAPAFKVAQPGTFDGSGRAVDWVFLWTEFFAIVGLDDPDAQVRYIGLNLTGSALLWYRSLILDDHRFDSVDDFRTALQLEFGDIDAERAARDELSVLRQTGSISEYLSEFRRIKLLIPSMNPPDTLDAFLRGLQDDARIQVYLHAPDSLEAAATLARRYEDACRHMTQTPRDTFQRSTSPLRPVPSSMDLDVVSIKRSKLTDKERSRLRRIGGCFYCRKVGHTKQDCPARAASASAYAMEASLNAIDQ